MILFSRMEEKPMSDLVFSLPHETYFGVDIIHRLGSIVSRYGDRVLLVTEAILYERNTIEHIAEFLEKKNISFIVYDEVVPNATSTAVEEALLLSRGSHAQVVIGMGGIRALSMAKAIAMASPGKMDIDEYMSGKAPTTEPLAYIEIPTTCRSPFMFTDECLLVDARDRTGRIVHTQKNITKAILFDPKLSITLPAKYTAATLLDTFLAAFEGYISAKANLLSDTLFLKAFEYVIETLKPITSDPEDIRLRIHACYAGLFTAIGLSMSRSGLGSALTYAINSKLMVPKSWISTLLFPKVINFFTNTSSEKIATVAKLLGEDIDGISSIDASHKAAEAIQRIISELSFPSRLRDLNLKMEDMMDIASTARGYDMMNYNPRMASIEELYEILKDSY
ncbi:MAG: iron-containing alcohol dehydrogenase [Spirochaetaceae bacterium]|nr:MAG: iron-containing alcohol dehydrogenase [Spirochaetaceae bacterium]